MCPCCLELKVTFYPPHAFLGLLDSLDYPQGPSGAACQCWSYGVSDGVCHRWSSGVRVACRCTNLYCQFHRRPMSHHLSPRRITLALTLVQKPICIVLAKEEARIIIIISIGNNNMCLKEKRWKTDAEILKYCFMIQKSDKLYFHYIVKSL